MTWFAQGLRKPWVVGGGAQGCSGVFPELIALGMVEKERRNHQGAAAPAQGLGEQKPGGS